MPELFSVVQRKESRSSKSFVTPPVQRRKVLPSAGVAAVVSPWITPSRTLHSRGSPDQPSRSLPLNSAVMPAASGGAATGASRTGSAPTPGRATGTRVRATAANGTATEQNSGRNLNTGQLPPRIPTPVPGDRINEIRGAVRPRGCFSRER